MGKRLAEHNAGKTKSNKHFIPWEIAYFETFTSIEEAISRERFLNPLLVENILKRFFRFRFPARTTVNYFYPLFALFVRSGGDSWWGYIKDPLCDYT